MKNILIIENDCLICDELNNKEKYVIECVKYGGQNTDRQISDKINAIPQKEFDLIIIEARLGIDDAEYTGILFALHIRLSENKFLKYLPIIIVTEDTKEEILQEQIKDNTVPLTSILLFTEGCHINKISNLITELNNEAIFNKIDEKELNNNILPVLKLDDSKDNRHQIANEWGAVKLALNAGYSTEDINYDFPQTLYFKFLKQKYPLHHLTKKERKEIKEIKKYSLLNKNDQLNLSSLLSQKKILLIDDNAGKGWEAVLNKIFNCEITSLLSIEDTINQISKSHINYKEFNLVFLDLYMPYKAGESPDKTYDNSIQLLNKLKEICPQIPIIVFTASNKSWTLNEVLEKGADSMYVKEGPEHAGDEQYSKDNFKTFLTTIVQCLNRDKILRPYWENIEKIINNNNFKHIQEKGNTKFIERIKERLKMFYGLLKRGTEQRAFNEKMFYFSDYELAFMTLWSILNEIQEAYYEKTQPSIKLKDKNGNVIDHSITTHDDWRNTPITYLDAPQKKYHCWQIKNQNDIFVKYDYYTPVDKNNNPQKNKSGYYIIHYTQRSKLSFSKGMFHLNKFFEDTKSDYEDKLLVQIAFLIYKKKILQNICDKQREKYLIKLKNLNDIRNKLFLTHGEYVQTGFYDQTEQNKRKNKGYNITPKESISDLFSLVGFLLTGEDIELDFDDKK